MNASGARPGFISRLLLLLIAWGALIPQPEFGQGIASRRAPVMPRSPRSGKAFTASFTDVAARAGLTAPIIHGGRTEKYIIESMGSGVAFFDFDNDGWPDIFLVNGSRLDGFALAQSPTNHLYRNNQDGTFTDVTAKAGLAHSGWGQGVCIGDYDNDGSEDLFITYWGRNVLYHNNGDGTFRDVSREAGVSGDRTRWGTGCSFFDYNRDGRLDLFVANYLDLDLAATPAPGSISSCAWLGLPVFCGPRGLPFSSNILYRNKGDGTFEDVSLASGIGAAKQTYALGTIAADLDGDGWQDLYIASDSTRSLFYHNNGDGTFSEMGVEAGLAYDDDGMEQAGMGIAIGDYDSDGLPDIAKTNFADDYPNLYRNLGKGVFQDVSAAAGLGVNPQYVLWSVVFADFDNDGRQDLLMAAGHVFSAIGRLKSAQTYRNPRLLYWNLGDGRFEDVSDRSGPGILARHSSRGAAAGDFDNDGNLDVLIMNMNEPPSLLKNTGNPGNHWLKVRLIGVESNRSAIGAKITVTSQGRKQCGVVLSQSGYLSHNDSRLHFGLGLAATVDRCDIVWPNGLAETLRDIKPDQTLTVREGSGVVRK